MKLIRNSFETDRESPNKKEKFVRNSLAKHIEDKPMQYLK